MSKKTRGTKTHSPGQEKGRSLRRWLRERRKRGQATVLGRRSWHRASVVAEQATEVWRTAKGRPFLYAVSEYFSVFFLFAIAVLLGIAAYMCLSGGAGRATNFQSLVILTSIVLLVFQQRHQADRESWQTHLNTQAASLEQIRHTTARFREMERSLLYNLILHARAMVAVGSRQREDRARWLHSARRTDLGRQIKDAFDIYESIHGKEEVVAHLERSAEYMLRRIGSRVVPIEKVGDFYSEILNDCFATQSYVRDMLTHYEQMAVGVNRGLFRLATIDRSLGTQIVDAFLRWESFVYLRRRRERHRHAFNQFQFLAACIVHARSMAILEDAIGERVLSSVVQAAWCDEGDGNGPSEEQHELDKNRKDVRPAVLLSNMPRHVKRRRILKVTWMKGEEEASSELAFDSRDVWWIWQARNKPWLVFRSTLCRREGREEEVLFETLCGADADQMCPYLSGTTVSVAREVGKVFDRTGADGVQRIFEAFDESELGLLEGGSLLGPEGEGDAFLTPIGPPAPHTPRPKDVGAGRMN